VGQASMHRLQEPHWFSVGSLSERDKKAVVRISTRKTYEPYSGIISILFFPMNPMPDAHAKLLSRIGAESTQTLVLLPGHHKTMLRANS